MVKVLNSVACTKVTLLAVETPVAAALWSGASNSEAASEATEVPTLSKSDKRKICVAIAVGTNKSSVQELPQIGDACKNIDHGAAQQMQELKAVLKR